MDEVKTDEIKAEDVTIEFPCDYPIKVIVDNDPQAIESVKAIGRESDPNLGDKIELKPSKNGNYVSVRMSFWATGTPQLEALFEALKKLPTVRMVL